MKEVAEKNIRLQKSINLISWVVFLIPVATLFYTHAGMSIYEIIFISNVATFFVRLLELPTSVLADTLWRKTSLLASVSCNLLSAITILLFPSYEWFIVASFFASLYWSFWSGTWQAFLEENLSLLNKKKEFGKVIGEFMFFEKMVGIVTPLIAWLILKYLWDTWYMLLAVLDVLFASVIVWLTYLLTDIGQQKLWTRKELWYENIHTAKQAIANISSSKKLQSLLVYRTFWNHIAYLPLIILPLLLENGMEDRMWGVLMTLSAIFLTISYKLNWVVVKKIWYKKSWLFSVWLQWVILALFWYILWTEVRIMWVLFVLFTALDWFWQPSWNHILVHNTEWKAIATTRSIVFSIFALWATIWKRFLSFFSQKTALILVWIFIVCITLLSAKSIMKLEE